jgi:hypothetical protein
MHRKIHLPCMLYNINTYLNKYSTFKRDAKKKKNAWLHACIIIRKVSKNMK